MKSNHGIDILSSGLDVEDLVYFNVGDKTKLYRDFVRLMGRYDYIVLDFPPGYNENLESFYESSDYLIIVTTPEPTALINTYTFIKIMAIKGVEPHEIHVVMNMVKDLKEGRKTLEKLISVIERFIGVAVTATHVMKYENLVKKSVYQQQPFVVFRKTAQPSLAIHRISDMIVKEKRKTKKSIFEKIKAFLGIG
jgi:flagellar biosynthesis protein FlhG